MSYRSLLRTPRFLVLAALVVTFTTTAFAQVRQPLPPRSDADLLAQYEPAQINEFRNSFREIFADDEELLTAMGKGDAARSIGQARVQLESMSDADVARMMATGVDLRPLMEATEKLRKVVEQGRAEAALKIAPNSNGLPGASYSFCGSERNGAEGMFAAQIVLDVAKGVWSAASRGCDEVIVVAGFGGNVSLVCIIVDAVLAAAEAVYNGFLFCDGDIDSAEIEGSYDRLGHIHGDLESAQSTIVNNDNSNKTEILNQINANTTIITTAIDASATAIINNDNSNRNTIINNDNSNRDTIITNDNTNRDTIISELRAIGCDVIRLLNTPEGQRSSANSSCEGQPAFPYDFPEKKIAASVARVFPSLINAPAEGTVVGRSMNIVSVETHLLDGKLVPSYYLPASRGGMIEQIKSLVWSTIQSQEELGIAVDETRTARTDAATADEMLGASRYVDAYRAYASAYQKLVPKN